MRLNAMDRAPDIDKHAPIVVWAYGILGLAPFASGAVASVAAGGAERAPMQLGLLIYGCLILTFLGGGRWGLEITRRPIRGDVVSGSMAGAVVSTLLVAATGVAPGWRLLVLALAHVGQWAWDVRSVRTPGWYPQLRLVLTCGAVASLLIGAAASLLR